MASQSLGTLTLNLVAQVGGFVAGMDKAERSSAKWRKQVEKSAAAAGKAIGAASAVAAGAMAVWIKSSINQAAEIENLARVAGTGTTEFQRFAIGAKTVGIENDKLSDILKDVNDKVGDFLVTGGGPMADFFEKVAPLVGVTADQFKNLSGPEALGLYVDTLEKAGANEQELTFFMEAIASDATALIPLLRNSGREMGILADEAQGLGLILSEETIKGAKQFNDDLALLGRVANGVGQQIAADLLPELTNLTNELRDPETIKAAADMAKAVVGSFTSIIVGARNTVKFIQWASESAAAFMGGIASDDIVRLNDEIERLEEMKASGALDRLVFFGRDGMVSYYNDEELDSELVKLRAAVESAMQASGPVILPVEPELKTSGTGLGLPSKEEEKAQAEAAKARDRAAKDAAAAVKKINDAFTVLETDYERQIELINTSTDAQKNATEADKLRFEIASGKLVGINALQQERLTSLADELDALNKLKAANEDNAKAAAFAANLQSANDTTKAGFELELAGAGMGDKARERLKQDIAIRQDYNQQMADLQRQLNAGDITQDLYNQETEILSDALAERVGMQRDYYSALDGMESSWRAGASEGLQNYADQAADVYGQTAELIQGTMESLSSGIADSLTGAILHGEDLRESMEALGQTIIESVLNSLIEMGVQYGINAALEAAGITAVSAVKIAATATETAADLAATATVSGAEVAAAGTVAAAQIAAIGATTSASLAATATTTSAQVAAGATTTAAWTPAAIVSSIGSFGTAAAVGLAAVIAALAFGKGFRSGGYTGSGGVDEVAGVVHGKEFVFDAAATSRIGVGNLEAIRSGKLDNTLSRARSDMAAQAGGASSSGGRPINIVVNQPGITDARQARQSEASARRAIARGVAQSGRYT